MEGEAETEGKGWERGGGGQEEEEQQKEVLEEEEQQQQEEEEGKGWERGGGQKEEEEQQQQQPVQEEEKEGKGWERGGGGQEEEEEEEEKEEEEKEVLEEEVEEEQEEFYSMSTGHQSWALGIIIGGSVASPPLPPLPLCRLGNRNSLRTLMEMKFAPDSFATALATRVLPQPGGPKSSTPQAADRPMASKRFGNLIGSVMAKESSSLRPLHGEGVEREPWV